MNKQALKYLNDADRRYLGELNRRVLAGERHLEPMRRELLTLAGRTSRELKRVAK